MEIKKKPGSKYRNILIMKALHFLFLLILITRLLSTRYLSHDWYSYFYDYRKELSAMLDLSFSR